MYMGSFFSYETKNEKCYREGVGNKLIALDNWKKKKNMLRKREVK